MVKVALFPKDSIIRMLFRTYRRQGRSAFLKSIRWWIAFFKTGISAKLISLSDYRDRFGLSSSKIIFQESVELVGGPQFANETPPNIRALDIIESKRQRVEVIELKNASAIPATDFIIKDGFAIHPDLFDPHRDVCHSERVGTTKLFPRTSKLATETDPSANFEKGIILFGQCAGNYSHFLTEVLPKLLVIDQIEEYRDFPLIIDYWIDQNMKDVLRHFNQRNREIHELNYGQPAFCKRLVFVTPTSYAPPEYREFLLTKKLPYIDHENYSFNREALNLVRQKAHSLNKPAEWIGKKLFIRRVASAHGNGRTALNCYAMEEIARRAGFDIIEPGGLSASEQISAFMDAEIVISQIGAAMANLIFTKPGCRVICLSPYYDDAEYYYWHMMNEALGHDLSYITGPQIADDWLHPLHRNYRIQMEDFYKRVRGLC